MEEPLVHYLFFSNSKDSNKYSNSILSKTKLQLKEFYSRVSFRVKSSSSCTVHLHRASCYRAVHVISRLASMNFFATLEGRAMTSTLKVHPQPRHRRVFYEKLSKHGESRRRERAVPVACLSPPRNYPRFIIQCQIITA